MAASKLLTELQGGTSTPCKLCAYLNGLASDAHVEWDEALAMPVSTIGNTAVVESLRRRGVKLSEAAVRRHRRSHR